MQKYGRARLFEIQWQTRRAFRCIINRRNTMNQGIVYVRVSSNDQLHGTSLESQERACIEYAENKGLKVAKVFIERGESATAANRTELIKALDYCKEHKDEIKAFIVWKLDRFARNMTDHYGLQAQLLKYGTSLHSVTEEIISEGPVGKMLEAMLAGYAQFENDIRKQRCEGGMRARLRDGISPWMPPIGYTNSKNRVERRKLLPDQPDEERFYLIQKGLRLYAGGQHTITQLAEESNKWGLQTRTGKPMSKQLWNVILTNKFYAGVLTDPWSGDEHRGLHKPMITLEEYGAIQNVKRGLSNNATSFRLKHHPDFPLRGAIRCTCGSFMTASWQTGRSGKKYPYYRCHNLACTNRDNITKDVLEKKFYGYLKRITPTEKFVSMFEQVMLDEIRSRKTSAGQEKQHYAVRLGNLENQKRRLLTLRVNNEISKEEYTEMRDSLDNQLTGLRIAKNEAQTSEADLEIQLAYGTKFVRDVARQWLDLTNPAKKQRLQKLVLPGGIVYDKATGLFGTAILSPIFKLSEDFRAGQSDLVAGAGIEPASGGSFTPAVSSGNGLYHNPIGTLPL
ncbi:MAG: hypothetical protein B7X03_01875 [Parcubacteria group bacterium 21-58-10]|nr:MAG: hypothetical protein B7X03_01875 [Parcubacteria group bacterium 21-58-10]